MQINNNNNVPSSLLVRSEDSSEIGGFDLNDNDKIPFSASSSPTLQRSESFGLSLIPLIWERALSFTDFSTEIHNRLKDNNQVWMHGSKEICDYVVDQYLATNPSFNIFHIDGGENLADLSLEWNKTMKTVRRIGENGKTNLFIIRGIKKEDRGFLHVLKERQKLMVLSDQPLVEDSLPVSFDRSSAEKLLDAAGISELVHSDFLDSFSDLNPYMLEVAIAIYNKHGQKFLEEWRKWQKPFTNSREKDFITFALFILKVDPIKLNELHDLLFFKNTKVKSDFFKTNPVFDILKTYRILQPSGEHFFFPEKVRHAMVDLVGEVFFKQTRNYVRLTEKLRDYVGPEFNDNNCWVIPHILFLFKQHKENCHGHFLFPLLAFMWKIGHFYTQQADKNEEVNAAGASRAKKISIAVRDRIEEYFGKGFVEKPPEKLVNMLEEKHPLLAHLYINLQYQIGRCYFYAKDLQDRAGSRATLEFAHELAKHLWNGESLLLRQILRNGLLFHLNAEGRYQESKEGYESPLFQDKVLDVQYHDESKKTIDLGKDDLNQIVCKTYILLNLIHIENVQDEEVMNAVQTLLKHQPNLGRRQLLTIVEAYLKIKQVDQAISHFEVLDKKEMPISDQLQLIEKKMQCCFIKEQFAEIKKLAQDYRRIAETYYRSGYYGCYQYIAYEHESYCRQTKELKPLSTHFSEENRQRYWTYEKVKSPELCIFNGIGKEPKGFPFKVKFQKTPGRKIPKGSSALPNTSLKGRVQHTLSNGQNSLVLGDSMYRYLSRKGEIGSLLVKLESKAAFKESIFARGDGYRLQLENETLEREEVLPCIRRFVDKMGEDNDEWVQFAKSYIILKGNRGSEVNEDELYDVAQQIKDNGAKPFEVEVLEEEGIENFFCKNQNRFHFPKGSTFAYHVLKHSKDICKNPTDQLFSQNGDFNLQGFHKMAEEYLQKARNLIKDRNMVSELPDQKEDHITDYAFYLWERKPENFAQICQWQERVATQRKKIKEFENEKKNWQYWKVEKPRNFKNDYNALLTILKQYQEHLDKYLRDAALKVNTYFTVLRVVKREKVEIFFKTYYYNRNFDLEKVRDSHNK